MKKRIISIISLLAIVSIFSFWVIDPYSINPFAEHPISLAESEITFQSSPTPDYKHKFKTKADSIVDNAIIMNDFVGVSTGVYKEGCGTYLANAGFKSKQSQERSDKNTRHRTASIAKPITAIAIMQLWEAGLIELDVAIQTYLPEFPTKPEGDITIRQLLKHTSGVQHYSSTWDGISFTHYNNLLEALAEFKDRPLSFAPGTGYEYTTYGYSILGAIIEKVSTLRYQEYMLQNVFLPSGMLNTDLEEADIRYANKAALYIKLGSHYIKSPKTDLSVKYPGGGFHTTAADLLKFGIAILEHTLVDSTTLDMMITSTDTLKQGTPYGFGWFVIDSERHGRILQHGGSQSGTSSYFQILLDQKIVATTLANNFGSDDGVYWLSRDLTKLISDPKHANSPVHYLKPQSDDLLEQYVGSYTDKEDTFIISKKGNQLFCQTKYYPPLPIFPNSQNKFFFRNFDGGISFQKTKNGLPQLESTYRGEASLYMKTL